MTHRGRRSRSPAPILAATILAVTLVIGGILSALVVLSAGAVVAMLLMELRDHSGHDNRASGHDRHTAAKAAAGKARGPAGSDGGVAVGGGHAA